MKIVIMLICVLMIPLTIVIWHTVKSRAEAGMETWRLAGITKAMRRLILNPRFWCWLFIGSVVFVIYPPREGVLLYMSVAISIFSLLMFIATIIIWMVSQFRSERRG